MKGCGKVNNIDEIIKNFQFEGEYLSIEPFGCGHINSTYAVYFKFINKPPVRYILQKINTSIFKNPIELMQNIDAVTNHLKNKIIQNNGNPNRETLTIIKTKDNNLFYKDKDNNYWRAYIFIEDATCYQVVERPILFYNAAKAFGRFQNLLSDFEADRLFEVIPNFHNTVSRYDDFLKAVEQDICGRASSVKEEIDFVKARQEDCSIIVNLIKENKIPLRVTHNDTKLNNIMIDNKTDEGICIIDLDTIMPGSVLYDFGDSIRFGASSAEEDEIDLSKVNMVMDLFEEYTKGYLSEAATALTDSEIKNLALGAKIMTLECGIRFLGDYLNGDIYFKIHRDKQNLDRARTQFKLVKDMENKFDKMNDIVTKYQEVYKKE